MDTFTLAYLALGAYLCGLGLVVLFMVGAHVEDEEEPTAEPTRRAPDCESSGGDSTEPYPLSLVDDFGGFAARPSQPIYYEQQVRR